MIYPDRYIIFFYRDKAKDSDYIPETFICQYLYFIKTL